MQDRTLTLVAGALLLVALGPGAARAGSAGRSESSLSSQSPAAATAAYPLEVMLVLDRSGSLSGTPIAQLKTAAGTFVQYFSGTQDVDKMGLISFATSVTVARPLGTNYVSEMGTAINAMAAVGATNAEDALDQADGPDGFTDQGAIPPEGRARQALVFFSDGHPTAFRGDFLRGGTLYDAVACATGNCASGDGGATYGDLGKPAVEAWFGASPLPTGDGNSSVKCPGSNQTLPTTRWYVFDTSPVPGYAPTANCIPDAALHDRICNLATDLALAHAQELKDRGVTIFTIGLGANVNAAFMQGLATDPGKYYYAPTAQQLEGIFQAIAMLLQPPATPARRATFGSLKLLYR